jgi:hypothetical protein
MMASQHRVRPDARGHAQALIQLLNLPMELRMQIYSYLPESCETIDATDLESFTSMGSLHIPVRRKWFLTGNSTLSLASTGQAIRADLLQHLLQNFRIDLLRRKLPLKQIEQFMKHYNLNFDFWHNVRYVRATYDYFSFSQDELGSRVTATAQSIEELISNPLVHTRPDSLLRGCALKHKRQQEELNACTNLCSLEIVYTSSTYTDLWRDKTATEKQSFLQDLVDVVARNLKLSNLKLVIVEKGWEGIQASRAQECWRCTNEMLTVMKRMLENRKLNHVEVDGWYQKYQAISGVPSSGIGVLWARK